MVSEARASSGEGKFSQASAGQGMRKPWAGRLQIRTLLGCGFSRTEAPVLPYDR